MDSNKCRGLFAVKNLQSYMYYWKYAQIQKNEFVHIFSLISNEKVFSGHKSSPMVQTNEKMCVTVQ